MKAVVLDRSNESTELSYTDITTPETVGPEQVLVKLQAAAINPIDLKIRAAPERFPIAKEGAILGCDGAGVIEAVGDAVSGFNIGDEVYFCQCGFNGRQGNYAEYAVVDQCFLAHKPANISFEEAAAAPLVLITAWEALFDRANLSAGDKVLIHAGAGGVGHVAIQLAKAKGALVATTISNDEKAAFVKSLGADLVINYKEQSFIDAVHDWSDKQGVDVVLDTVGGDLIEQSFEACKVYGDVVTILGMPADINMGTARLRNLRVTQELMLSPTMLELESAKAHQGEILKQACELFEQGKLSVKVAATLPLEQATEAHRRLEDERPMGKLVLRIE